MHLLDWLIVGAYLGWLIRDGLRRTHSTNEIDGYLLAKRSLPWWAAGLSVMATQLSAITLVGTTGQGYSDGMRFVQFYFGLPIAMVILSLTVVPFFYRAKVYTAYEFLERRFDAKVRALATLLFLGGRSLSSGVVIAAPAVILSVVLGWNLSLTVLAIGAPTVVYTMFGGVQAVAWTDVKQMAVIVAGVAAAVVALVLGLPPEVGLTDSLHLAGAVGRLKTLDFSFSLTERYTVWSGTLAGLFLMLSYFGCDQSQVQRYLTARSIDESRRSLLMSAYFKIPLQAFILLTGVLVFAFYVFTQPPMLFNPVHQAGVESSNRAADYRALDRRFGEVFEERRKAAHAYAEASDRDDTAAAREARAAFARANSEMAATRGEAAALVREVTGDRLYEDVNYVFPTFITTHLPTGLIGLMIAAIFAAAMSSAAGEMNSLATATVIDVYRRHVRVDATDAHYLAVSKAATAFWGLVACMFALYAARAGSLIEVVNMVGSLFYGTLLGAFVLAIATRRATGTGTFVGMIAGFAAVIYCAWTGSVSYLWYNVVGTVVVVVVGLLVSAVTSPRPASR
ncbi:MAG TPA: sodium:solute symporter [Vicinamibacterales bacterium]|mgnify:FL=1|nr:sodium:solute symporter [Vicinamibacterales bacterium]